MNIHDAGRTHCKAVVWSFVSQERRNSFRTGGAVDKYDDESSDGFLPILCFDVPLPAGERSRFPAGILRWAGRPRYTARGDITGR